MNKRQKLDTLSRNLFFSGLIVARFSKVSLAIIANSSFILAALFYLAGYVVWQISVNEVNDARQHIAEKLKQRFEREYLHMPQYSFSAILGIAASLALLGSLFLPQILGIVSACLFLSSNLFWWWAEDINIKRLREDKPESAEHKARELYYNYTNLSTLNSAVYAISLALYALLPALALPLSMMISTFLLALTIQTFHFWGQSAYANSQLTEKEVGIDIIELNTSYLQDQQSYLKLQSRKDFKPALDNIITKENDEAEATKNSASIDITNAHAFTLR